MNSLAKIPLVVIELTGKLSEALRNFHGPSSKLCVVDSEHLNEREKGDRLTGYVEGERDECTMHRIYEEIIRKARYNKIELTLTNR